jgi:hypothetical protein
MAQSLYFTDQRWPKGIVGSLRATQDGKFEIFYMDIQERKEMSRALPDVPNCKPAPTFQTDITRSFITKDSRMAIIELACSNNMRKVLGLSIDTGAFYFTGENDTLLWMSDDAETFMVGQLTDVILNSFTYNSGNVRIVQARTGIVEASQMDPHLQTSSDRKQFEYVQTMYYGYSDLIKTYSKNSTNYIAAFSAGSQWSVQLKNLNTRVESTVCKNALGAKIALLNFTEEQVALVTFDPGNNIYVYEVSESATCKLLNSAPVKHKAIRALTPTKSGLGVAISTMPGISAFMFTGSPDDIYFLNKDGRAPLHLNLNNPNFSIIVDMQVSADHSKLYILGTGMGASIYQTLFWLKL